MVVEWLIVQCQNGTWLIDIGQMIFNTTTETGKAQANKFEEARRVTQPLGYTRVEDLKNNTVPLQLFVPKLVYYYSNKRKWKEFEAFIPTRARLEKIKSDKAIIEKDSKAVLETPEGYTRDRNQWKYAVKNSFTVIDGVVHEKVKENTVEEWKEVVPLEDAHRLFVRSHIDQKTGEHRCRVATFEACSAFQKAFPREVVGEMIKCCSHRRCVLESRLGQQRVETTKRNSTQSIVP